MAATASSTGASSRNLATQYFMLSHDDPESARRELYSKFGIVTSYDPKVMIFSTMHSAKNQLGSDFTQECNGLIMEQKTWRLLVVPPKSLRFNIDTDASNKFLHQGLYRIYKAEDGTCFNLYFYGGKWTISTNKGYNMNQMKWNQDEDDTYESLITECLEKIGLTWETFISSLDQSHCYSFGFKHPKFHKFFEGRDAPIYKIWFIQSVDLDPTSPKYLWSSDKTPIAIIETQTICTTPASNLKEMYRIAGTALEDYETKGEVCYGFILRSSNYSITKYHSDLYIESSLMKTIRKFWYENTLIKQCHEHNWSKEIAITLNAFLDNASCKIFTHLFAQYEAQLDSYLSMLNKIVDKMIDIDKAPAEKKESPVPDLEPKVDPVEAMVAAAKKEITLDEKIEKVAIDMLRSFKSNVSYKLSNKKDEEKRRIFVKYVHNPFSLELMMTIY